MSPSEIRLRLYVLQLERLEAETTGLTHNARYMADLESERAECRQALVNATIEEVLSLRSALGMHQYG
ncbi:MAG: hypothetical protein QOE08_1807 [Thermoleophilaceae bacterium]|jgi:hypothetical protein|nr:hypothetical protein [Thermoleophilaceae bacterium]